MEKAIQSSDLVFQDAIRREVLSERETDANYAGDYMYMGVACDPKYHAFKHRETRKYLFMLIKPITQGTITIG